MKGIIVLGLAGFGAYSIFRWYVHCRMSPAGQNAANSTTTNTGFFSRITGTGEYFTNPNQAGVPSYPDIAIPNRPDQVWAAYHNNPLATIPGQMVYEPAFGPTVNRGGVEVF